MKKRIPKKLLKLIRPFYHNLISYIGAFLNGYPSKKMIVIGVTGTKGKSSTVWMIDHMLTELGYIVGVSSSIYFKDGVKTIKNDLRNSMPGRFFLHKLMKTSLSNNVQIFIMEVTSEGLVQGRHKGIQFDTAIFLNLYPEHLESHGGFENYKKAKGLLFKSLKKSKNKIIAGKTIQKTIIANQDDTNFEYYNSFKADRKISFSLNQESVRPHIGEIIKGVVKEQQNTHLGFDVIYNDKLGKVNIPLLGLFNVYNTLGSMAVGVTCGHDIMSLSKSVSSVKNIPGRMNVIAQDPTIIIDYAHIPAALELVYAEIQQRFKKNDSRIIAVLGSAGGGRDIWKRGPMGELAGKYADYVIVTNEDPFDEDPQQIIDQVFAGVIKVGKKEGRNAWKILERQEAFKKALKLANKQDIIIITGKGSEKTIVGKNGQQISWNDEQEMHKLINF